MGKGRAMGRGGKRRRGGEREGKGCQKVRRKRWRKGRGGGVGKGFMNVCLVLRVE